MGGVAENHREKRMTTIGRISETTQIARFAVGHFLVSGLAARAVFAVTPTPW